jgi:purine-binding chemotaxis protein CheW
MSDNVTLYCTFLSAGRLFGVPVLDVKEVTAETRFTRIPHAPQEVLGLVNIRGHIFLALNLATLLAVRDHKTRTDSQFVIFKSSVGAAFGIVVDQVGDIVSVSDSQTEAVSNGEQLLFSDRSSLVASVGKLDGQLLIILDPRKFLACVEHSRGALANV